MKIFAGFILVLASLGLLLAATPPDHEQPAIKAPEFVFNMQDGKQLLLSSFRGKVVAISFMFTTCPHCQAFVPVLATIQKDYAAKGVQIIGDVIDAGAREGLANFNALYVRGAFPCGWSSDASAREFMGIQPGKNYYVPMMAFIDRKGYIRGRYIGDNEFFQDGNKSVRAELDKLLGAPAHTVVTKK